MNLESLMDIRLLWAEKETDAEMCIAWTNRRLGFFTGLSFLPYSSFLFFHLYIFKVGEKFYLDTTWWYAFLASEISVALIPKLVIS